MPNTVTLAIASYNNAPYIERCVDSVISQSFENLEILIVDDGSTDDTLSRIGRYKADGRVRIIVKENGGLSSVRQRALVEAKGDYISFIDADDYIDKDYVRIMIEALERSKADVCICSSKFEDEDGDENHTEELSFQYEDNSMLYKTESENSIAYLWSTKLTLSDSWNKMYKMEFVKKSKVRFELPKGFNGSDFVFNHKLFIHNPSYCSVKEQLYNHVLYSKSAVHRCNKNLQDGFIEITNQIYKEIQLTGNKQAFHFLSNVYGSSVSGAFVDVKCEHSSLNSLASHFSSMKKKHIRFLRMHPSLDMVLVDNPRTRYFLKAIELLPSILIAFIVRLL